MTDAQRESADADSLTVRIDGVELRWTGGRLADVWMPTEMNRESHPVECLQQPGWDTETFSFVRPPTRRELKVMLSRWMRDHYAETWENA